MKTHYFFVFILIVLFTTSCNKSEDDGSGTGDAIIIAKKSGTNTVYGVTLYAYSFSPFQSVKATNAVDAAKTYTLKVNQGYKTNYYYETPDAEFTVTKPAATTFNFSAVFENGVTDEFEDNLTDKVLALPTIEKAEYNLTSADLGVTWKSVPDADSYAINVFDGTNLVYSSPELVNTLKYFAVGSSSGWVAGVTPVSGKTYTVRVLAFLYEPNGDSYNIQAVSMADSDKPIAWGI